MLGIFIGITVVVLMSTAIKGIDNSFQKGISALGSDVYSISVSGMVFQRRLVDNEKSKKY